MSRAIPEPGRFESWYGDQARPPTNPKGFGVVLCSWLDSHPAGDLGLYWRNHCPPFYDEDGGKWWLCPRCWLRVASGEVPSGEKADTSVHEGGSRP
jgi:hypothetical protein